MEQLARILLVEDNDMDIELTIDAFAEAKLLNRIDVARTGEEAIEYCMGTGKYTDRSIYPMPDLILLDLKLPGIDGFEVLQRIKSTPVLKRIPVIILTSSQEEADRSLSYDIGTNSYLIKPISFDGFLEVVKQITNYWLSLNISPPKDQA